jgi:nucleoid DNA-binding protein/cell division septation protein DedD
MVLERAIHDLLHAHDCVIVPGYGGFLTHYRSARLDVGQRMLHPPGKDLSFNRNLTRSDGLLTDEVARLQGLGHELAKQRVEAVVGSWRSRLESEGRLELAQLGTFFLDAERNLQFEPDRRVNHLKDAYGLRPVPAVPVVRTAAPPASGTVRQLEPLAKEMPAERRSTVLWAAAAVTAVLFMAGTYLLVEQGTGKAQWSGIGPFGPREEPRYAPHAVRPVAEVPEAEVDLVLPDTGHGIQHIALDGTGSLELVVDLGPAPAPVAVPDTTAVAMRKEEFRFHVIGGCFGVKANADSYVADLLSKGFTPVLVDVKGGLYRVALGSYPSRSVAEEALAAARSGQAPDAWLLVK